MAGTAQRSDKIDIRISPSAKRILQEAAREQHTTISQFVIDSALSTAREVLIEQRYELGLMDAYLQARDEGRGAEDREVMGWMGPPFAIDEMPGLASPEQLDALYDADPDEQNVRFLELMIAHHRGGVDMAEYAARHAEDPRVRRLAEVMADVQAKEIREYEIELDRLGGA